jgi:hypothetical protein
MNGNGSPEDFIPQQSGCFGTNQVSAKKKTAHSWVAAPLLLFAILLNRSIAVSPLPLWVTNKPSYAKQNTDCG